MKFRQQKQTKKYTKMEQEQDNTVDSFKAEQTMKWSLYLSAAIILIAAILVKLNFIDIPIFLIITGVMISLYLGMKMSVGKNRTEAETAGDIFNWNFFNVIPKILLFVSYHTLLFTIVYFITIYFLKPMVDFQWHWFVEWLRKTLIVVYYAGGGALSIRSFMSCWNSGVLKEDEIGQMSIGGWMPKSGRNQTNGPLGVFTGLPAMFVHILSFSAKAPKIVIASPIQIPIHKDPNGKLFEAEFLWSGKVRIANTRTYILNPIRETKVFKECKGVINTSDVNKDWDIVNIVERTLTKYTNDPVHEFTKVADVKIKKDEIEEMLNKAVSKDLMKSHGIEFTEFFLESIEVPKVQITQQNEDAKARAATIAAEEREQLDNKSLIKQAKELQEASRDDDDKITLDFKEALKLAQIQQGKIRATAATISGSGVKGKRGGLGGVFLDGDG